MAAMLAFAVDVQVGVPRLWTAVGTVGTVIASWWLFEPLPGASLRPSWITLLAGIGGVLLTFVVGMPSMVRTRFATPTIGREWMIGELGDVVEAVDPDGVVSVARRQVAGPHQSGDARSRRRAGPRGRRSTASRWRSSRSRGRRATIASGARGTDTRPRRAFRVRRVPER